MPREHEDIRRLLSLLKKPHELEAYPLALALRGALRAPTAHSAVLTILHRTFAIDTPLNRAMRDVIELCDIAGCKASQASAKMAISSRTFFRFRAAAVSSVASVVKSVLADDASAPSLVHAVARIVVPIDSAVATHLLEHEAKTGGPQPAYEAVCVSIRNGGEPQESLLRRCTGHWAVLAQLEVARSGLIRGDAGVLERARTEALTNIPRIPQPLRNRANFELAYVDRLDALRRCDVMAMRSATRRMRETAGDDANIRGLAMICEAEQACDEGDLGAAREFISRIKHAPEILQNYRLLARTAHVAAVERFLQGSYIETFDLSEAACAALLRVEPGFALCAAAYAGRAALLLRRAWSRPTELCRRFPSCFQTGVTDLVWARHLADSDANISMSVVERATSVIVSQGAEGALAFARATRSLVLDMLGKQREAQADRVRAWEDAVQLGRAVYLYDLFAHPSQVQRDHGPFHMDQRFARAIVRRIMQLSGEGLDAISAGRVAAPLFDFLRDTRHASRISGVPHLEQLSIDLSWCLAPADRAAFIGRLRRVGASDASRRLHRSTKQVAI